MDLFVLIACSLVVFVDLLCESWGVLEVHRGCTWSALFVGAVGVIINPRGPSWPGNGPCSWR